MPELSDAQFHEHLGEFHRQLGLSVEPDALVLPSGHRLPTVQQFVHMSMGHDDKYQRYLYAKVASESGRIHSMTARLLTDRTLSDHASMDFNFEHSDSEHTAWYRPTSQHPGERDPKQFHADVQHILRTSKVANSEELRENARDLRDYAQNRGHIVVLHTPEAKEFNDNSRLYRFHTATGRLGPPVNAWASES